MSHWPSPSVAFADTRSQIASETSRDKPWRSPATTGSKRSGCRQGSNSGGCIQRVITNHPEVGYSHQSKGALLRRSALVNEYSNSAQHRLEEKPSRPPDRKSTRLNSSHVALS